MTIEKTNIHLTNDVSSLIDADVAINAEIDAIEAEDLTMVTTLGKIGLKDASGTNGDVFVQDTSVYIKFSSAWYYINASTFTGP